MTDLMHFFNVFIHFIFLHVSNSTVFIIRRSIVLIHHLVRISLCKLLLGIPVRRELLTGIHRLIHTRWCIRARSEPGGTREGKWRGNWRMEWVANTLTPSPNVVYPALLKLMRTPRLPAVDWTDAPTDLNALVRFEKRRNLVSARVPSRSARAIIQSISWWWTLCCLKHVERRNE